MHINKNVAIHDNLQLFYIVALQKKLHLNAKEHLNAKRNRGYMKSN